MNVKFLGTSSEGSIPREDCFCQQCKSKNLKDRRLRSSILINQKILIDASPDILKQLKPHQIHELDTVIITHEHDDHTGGIKYLLKEYPDLRIIRIRPGQHFRLLGIDFFAFRVEHSKMAPTVGIVANGLIYIPDSLSLDSAEKYLQEASVAALDGSMLSRAFGGHMAMNDIIAIVKPFQNLKKILFTHNGHTHKNHKEMTEVVQKLGDKRFSLAYDGQELEI